jgi:hypothetical protein
MGRDFFANLQEGLEADWKETGEARSESDGVNAVLRGLGLVRHRRALYDQARLDSDEPKLTFELFHRFFPGFPCRVEHTRIKDLKKRCTIGQTFCDFTKVPIIKAYGRIFGDEADDQQCALLFPWQGIKDGLVAHNAGVPVDMASFEGRKEKGIFLWVFWSEDSPITVERTQTFLRRFEGAWDQGIS